MAGRGVSENGSEKISTQTRGKQQTGEISPLERPRRLTLLFHWMARGSDPEAALSRKTLVTAGGRRLELASEGRQKARTGYWRKVAEGEGGGEGKEGERGGRGEKHQTERYCSEVLNRRWKLESEEQNKEKALEVVRGIEEE